MTRRAATLAFGVTLIASTPAGADHPMGGRLIGGLSPMLTALLTGALAFVVALVVIVVVMVVTKPRPRESNQDQE